MDLYFLLRDVKVRIFISAVTSCISVYSSFFIFLYLFEILQFLYGVSCSRVFYYFVIHA